MNSYMVNEDAIYRAIGELTVKFQLLENELREISWFCSEPAETTAGPARGFARIVAHTEKTLSAYLYRSGVEKNAGIRARFGAAFERCQDVATRRNRAVHTLYRHHETLYGAPVFVRTWVEKAQPGLVETRHERVTEETINPVLRDLTAVYRELFELHQELMYTLQIKTALRAGRPTPLS